METTNQSIYTRQKELIDKCMLSLYQVISDEHDTEIRIDEFEHLSQILDDTMVCFHNLAINSDYAINDLNRTIRTLREGE